MYFKLKFYFKNTSHSVFKLPNSIHTIIIYNAQRRYHIIARICFFRCMNVNAISRLKLKNYLASSLNRSIDFELFICLTHNTKRYPYAISSVVKRSDARELCARISLHLYRRSVHRDTRLF